MQQIKMVNRRKEKIHIHILKKKKARWKKIFFNISSVKKYRQTNKETKTQTYTHKYHQHTNSITNRPN